MDAMCGFCGVVMKLDLMLFILWDCHSLFGMDKSEASPGMSEVSQGRLLSARTNYDFDIFPPIGLLILLRTPFDSKLHCRASRTYNYPCSLVRCQQC